jgi:hypothetical protein
MFALPTNVLNFLSRNDRNKDTELSKQRAQQRSSSSSRAERKKKNTLERNFSGSFTPTSKAGLPLPMLRRSVSDSFAENNTAKPVSVHASSTKSTAVLCPSCGQGNESTSKQTCDLSSNGPCSLKLSLEEAEIRLASLLSKQRMLQFTCSTAKDTPLPSAFHQATVG